MFEAFGFSERVIREAYNVVETVFWGPHDTEPVHIECTGKPVSLCLGLAQLTSATGRIGRGVLCDRFFMNKRSTLLTMICAVATIGLVAMALINPANVHVAALLLSELLGATIASFAGITLTIASEASSPDRAATTVGFNLMMVSFGGVIGPPLFGYMMDYPGGYAAGWPVTAAAVAIALYLIRYVFVESRNRPSV